MATKKINKRINFSSIKSVIDYPDFLDVQLKSFVDFFQLDTPTELRDSEGLYKVFMENFPISDSRDNFKLEFIDYTVDPPRYSIQESIERGIDVFSTLKSQVEITLQRLQKTKSLRLLSRRCS